MEKMLSGVFLRQQAGKLHRMSTPPQMDFTYTFFCGVDERLRYTAI